jgi:hypothetical protein
LPQTTTLPKNESPHTPSDTRDTIKKDLATSFLGVPAPGTACCRTCAQKVKITIKGSFSRIARRREFAPAAFGHLFFSVARVVGINETEARKTSKQQ